jgi:MoaA/NifB/PqqE/SkfB family radical SAM enzyme
MLFKPYDMAISLDLTTYCNAKCPQCHRTDRYGLDRNERFPLVNVSFEKFKSAFTPDTIRRFVSMSLVPTWGDMLMHPEVYEICEYILKCHKDNPSFVLQMDTNGSMRDEDWWFKFGGLKKLNGPSLHVKFDVDGINQEMHEFYRRNTDLNKVLRNMQAFSETFAKTQSQTILFKHNQPYMKEIKELAEAHGSEIHSFVASERFHPAQTNDKGQYNFTFENTEYVLEKANPAVFKDPVISHLREDEDYERMKTEVVCRWSKDNKININFDGQVWPCCYFGYSDHGTDDPAHQSRFYSNELIEKYNKNRLRNNIYFTPIEEILTNEWWTEDLPRSIAEEPISQCERNCSFCHPDSVTQWRTLQV